MPIRLVDKSAVIAGRIASTVAHTALFSGTFSVVPSRSGTVTAMMGDHLSSMVGSFASNANRIGTIAQTLADSTAALTGTFAQAGNQAPVWASDVDQDLVVGSAFSIDLDTLCNDPEAQPITYSLSAGSLPAGLTQSGARGNIISGTPTLVGDIVFTELADDLASDELDWTERSTAPGVLRAENFKQSSYATRGALLAYYEALENAGDLPQGGIVYPYTGWGSGDPDKWIDPIPVGTKEKIGLHTTTYLTGGQALKLSMYASDGASEAGPAFEIDIPTPAPIYYVQMVWQPSTTYLAHNFGNGHRKILFLNHFGPGAGQIVGVMYRGFQPWPMAYRYTGAGPGQLRLDHSTGPSGYGQNFQLYGGINNNPGVTPATTTEWDQQFGPSFDNPDATDPDFASIPRVLAGRWNVTTYMIDQSYIGAVSRGMFKMWHSEYRFAPRLMSFNYRNCDFRDFAADLQARSVRPVLRPENPTNAPPLDYSMLVDQIIVTTQPPTHPGGYVLPYPGQQIPPGQPIPGTTDDIG